MPLRIDNNTRVALCALAAALVCGAIVWGGAHYLESRHQEFRYEAALENVAERREVASEGEWLEATSDPEAIIDHTPWDGTVSVRIDDATLYRSVDSFETVTGLSLDGAEMLITAENTGFDVVVVVIDLSVRNDDAHTFDAEDGVCNVRSQDFPLAVDNTPCSLSFCGAIVDDGLDINYMASLEKDETQSMSLVYALPKEGSRAVLGAMAQLFPPYEKASTLYILVGNFVDNIEGSIFDEYPFLLEVHPQEVAG